MSREPCGFWYLEPGKFPFGFFFWMQGSLLVLLKLFHTDLSYSEAPEVVLALPLALK